MSVENKENFINSSGEEMAYLSESFVGVSGVILGLTLVSMGDPVLGVPITVLFSKLAVQGLDGVWQSLEIDSYSKAL